MTQFASGLTAAVVAGGESSRFGGRPKGLEQVNGRRILDRVIDAVHSVTSDVMLISNASEAREWAVGVRVVKDQRTERGSIVGIHTALLSAHNAVLVVAWDMPFVSRPLMELIVERSVGEAFATVPDDGDDLHPFCAVYSQACLPFVEAAINRGELKVTRLLGELPTLTRVSSSEIERIGDPKTLLFNVNTQSDLQIAEAMAGEAPRRSPRD